MVKTVDSIHYKCVKIWLISYLFLILTTEIRSGNASNRGEQYCGDTTEKKSLFIFRDSILLVFIVIVHYAVSFVVGCW